MAGRVKNRRGFTLVELLTAMVLLSLVILPTLSVLRSSFERGERRNKEKLEANLILRSELANHNNSREERSIDTLTVSGFRFRVTNRIVTSGQDTSRFIVVMTERGARWDTLAVITKVQFTEVPVLSR